LIIEADGGARGNPGPAAYGALVRDAATGMALAERASSIGRASNNVAEYRGLLAGLELVRELDPDGRADVEVRMDSKLVIEQMAGHWKIKHEDMRALAARCRAALPPRPVVWTWVPRARNAAADQLANEALDAAERGQLWAPGEPTADRAPEPAGAEPVVDEAEVDPVPPHVLAVGTAEVADLGVPTTLLLLRHGRTPLTAAKCFSGSGGADPSLDEEGRRQAAAVAAALGSREDLRTVITSPLRRTRETAETVAATLGVAIEVEDGFRECAFGAWDGLTFPEVHRGWPREMASWLHNPAVAPPGGESLMEVAARVIEASDRALAAHSGETVLVVTHVTPIKMIVSAALGAPLASVYRMELSPASLTTVSWWSDGGASLRGFNDVAHLTALSGPLAGRLW
jgi:probable phosphoglycerate mutase